MRYFFTLLISLLLINCPAHCNGQIGADTALQEKLWTYIGQHPYTSLFVHTDKNIYAPAERIWLKAYLLAGPMIDSKVLYVRLLDANRKQVLATQYPMYGVRAHGDLLLPDTLRAGNYFLCAYADRMINFNPTDVFVQPIRIYKNWKRWQANAYVRDTSMLKRGAKVELIVKLVQNNDLVKGVKGHYELLDGTKVLKTGGLKTNLVGESFLDFTYPHIDDDRTLTVKMYYEDEQDFEEVLLHLGHEGNKMTAQAIPEGGHLVEGAVNNVAIVVTDATQNPVANATVTVQSGSAVLASATTNRLGMATVALKLAAAATYNLQLQANGKTQVQPLAIDVEKEGYVLTATTRDNKPVFTLYNHNKPAQVKLLARSFDEVLWTQNLTVPNNTEIVFSLPDTFPKQVIALDVLDDANQAVAERLWLNKQEEDCQVQLTCDKTQYGTRKRVAVTIAAKDNNGQPVKMNSSVAVAEVHTIDTAAMPQICPYAYFKNTTLPMQAISSGLPLLEEINKCLMTASWPGYIWNWITLYKPGSGIRIYKNTDGVYGTVTNINKKKKATLKDLTILSKEGIFFTPIDEYGNFNIPSEALASPKNNRKNLLLGENFYENHQISIRHYEEDFDKKVAAYNSLYPPPVFNTYSYYQEQPLEKLTDPHQLQNVVVRKTQDLAWKSDEFKSTTCNDYVCMFNILNCPNHHFGAIPVDGETYTYQGKRVVYRGCGNTETRSVIPLKMVYTPNVFPLIDFEKDSSSEEERRSTIYWNPNINTDSSGKATFTFFTNDITSTFTIRLQGITVQGLRPVMGNQTFMVK